MRLPSSLGVGQIFFAVLQAGTASAEPAVYGAFTHYAELPQVLFLTGEIRENESFELRRAMRDQEIRLVVPASAGGNLYEGLQIAAIIHDNKLGTYIPQGAKCESSCANIFLGGTSRMLLGELGVHQFYSGSADAAANAPQNVTTAVAQYTTSDIIGIMNQFQTPPFVYEKMFGTTDIYYFKASEKPRLDLGTENDAFIQTVELVDDFVAASLHVIEQQNIAVSAPAPTTTTVEPTTTFEEMAFDFLSAINSDWSLPNEQALALMPYYYAPSVTFYGEALSLSEVMAEKWKFAERWPIRSYVVDPSSVSVFCSQISCNVDAAILWSASSSERGADASGVSTWSVVLTLVDGRLRITSETGKTLKRN
jgi:hypothetical protein